MLTTSKKIGIICAVDRELAPFITHIDNVKITQKAMLKIYEGNIAGIPVTALFCGVCKVNAAIATQILIDHYDIDMVINAGTAGGMDAKLSLFDTVIATETTYHDVADDILTEYHPWMDTPYFAADKDLLRLSKNAVQKLAKTDSVFWGRMVTGEVFISNDGRQKINEKYAPLTVDMETASIAHVCYVNQIPFISIRCITDTATHSGEETFAENCEKASIIAKDIPLALMWEIKEQDL